jgi:predicted O-linked N-acetylglucosamine transferase (SPINDLY family)
MAAMDACLTDEDRDPFGGAQGGPARAERWYVERLVRLPMAAQAYDPDPAGAGDGKASAPPVSPLPAESAGHVTFACLNNPAKITPATLDLWAGVLAAVPKARLLLLAGPRGRAIARVAEGLSARGVDAESRVEWLARVPRDRYLAYYAERVDLALDAYPYAGHTTTLDALWMGVPTVTRVGPTHLTREGYAILKQVGLDELGAATDAEYLAAAARVAGDVPALRSLRRELRDRLRASPLMDGFGLAHRIEAALRGI